MEDRYTLMNLVWVEALNDPIVRRMVELIFDLSNKKGKEGMRMTNLKFHPPSKDDPLSQFGLISCEIIKQEDLYG